MIENSLELTISLLELLPSAEIYRQRNTIFNNNDTEV